MLERSVSTIGGRFGGTCLDSRQSSLHGGEPNGGGELAGGWLAANRGSTGTSPVEACELAGVGLAANRGSTGTSPVEACEPTSRIGCQSDSHRDKPGGEQHSRSRWAAGCTMMTGVTFSWPFCDAGSILRETPP